MRVWLHRISVCVHVRVCSHVQLWNCLGTKRFLALFLYPEKAEAVFMNNIGSINVLNTTDERNILVL